MSDKDIKWFHSKEGEKSFRDATTLQSRVLWIYQYLSLLSQDNDPKSLLKLAYIMADQMWDSPHRFSGWPNIIDKECNPFLILVENGEIQEFRDLVLETKSTANLFGEHLADKLLCALHDKEVSIFPYEELTDYQEDDTIYSIEREIIWFFSYSGQLNPIINYEIGPYQWVSSSEDDEQSSKEILKETFNGVAETFNGYKETWFKSRELSESILEQKRKAEDKKNAKKIIGVICIAAIVLLYVFVNTISHGNKTAGKKDNNSAVPANVNYEVADEINDNVTQNKEDVIGYAEVIIDELYIRSEPSTEGNKPKRFAEQNKAYEVFDIYYDGQFTWYKVGNEEWFADDDGEWVVFTPVSSN